MQLKDIKIAIIGLGYVGLPLAVEFGKKFEVIGFDVNKKRINELSNGIDKTLEVDSDELKKSSKLTFTDNENELVNADVYIITVPTPIDEHKLPDLHPLKSASTIVARYMSKGNYVIYESTVYPGATEEVCVPILENISKLQFNVDFYCGYSPERINPGDKEHTLTSIKKVTSGSTSEAATFINNLYKEIITAGTFKASSIKVAEAAKVIENTQRDINIALMNELSQLFNILSIDTTEVLEAAGSKWNFLNFKPGLVGGHCIGVDPYYLTYKANAVGYKPEIILAGRRLNDNMSLHVADQIIKEMLAKNIIVNNSKVLILGFTFKENCPDVRNTKVYDLVNELEKYTCDVDVFDPWIDIDDVAGEYSVRLINEITEETYDAIVLAVGHKSLIDMGVEKIRSFGKSNHIFYDLKSIFPLEASDCRL